MAFKFSGKDRTIRIYNLGADTREFIGAGDVCIPANTGLPADGKYCADGRVRGKSHRIYRNKVGDCRGLPKSNALQQRNGLGALPADVTTIAPDGNYMDWNGEGWEKDTEAECAAAVSFAESEKKRLMQEATLTIETLQDAVDLSFATDAEVECLIEWKKYRVPLSRVDINEAQDIQWSSPPVCN